jgi:hypothetical protein
VQYPISVAQAALAAEQVTSIRLSLSLGIPNVRIPDLLDALDDSRDALINVANARIGYIVHRSRFALDLEQMQLDETGFWPEIYDQDYQPRPRLTYPNGAGMTYGGVPEFLRVSDSIRRMNCQALPGWSLQHPPNVDGNPLPNTEPTAVPDTDSSVRPAHFQPVSRTPAEPPDSVSATTSAIHDVKLQPAKPATPNGWHATGSK